MHYGRTPLYKGTTKFVRGKAVFNGTLRSLSPDDPKWSWPLHWRGAEHPLLGDGEPSLIFTTNMGELFLQPRPIIDRIVGTLAISQHIGLLCTRVPSAMRRYFSEPQHQKIQQRRKEHLWLGVSAENQEWFDKRWPHMRPLAEAGWLVFVSVAPMLGPVILPPDFLQFGNRVWVIVSGEEDFSPRYMDPAWARALRNQCETAGVPVFVLGMSGRKPIPPDLFVRQFPRRVG